MHTYICMYQKLKKAKVISGADVILVTTNHFTGFIKGANDGFEVILKTDLRKDCRAAILSCT